MSVYFAVVSPLLQEVYLWLLSPFKTNICNFQFDPEWQTKNHFVDELPLNSVSSLVIGRYGVM